MERQDFFVKARRFISAKARIDPEQIKSDTPLVESGIVDSLLITELIIFVEDVLDIDIEVDDFRLTSFHTLDSIYETYGSVHV